MNALTDVLLSDFVPEFLALGALFVGNPPAIVAVIMTFSAGGIMYLMFQDVAPKVAMRKSWLPPMGALVGFFVGVLGAVLVD